MRKGTYKISLWEYPDVQLKEVTGWITTIEGVKVGICKSNLSDWEVTELSTGYRIPLYGNTRKEAITLATDILIKHKKKLPKYLEQAGNELKNKGIIVPVNT